MSFQSVKQLLRQNAKSMLPLWEMIMQNDIQMQGMTRADSINTMTRYWTVMKESVEHYQASDRSNSGLVGGDGARILDAVQQGALYGDAFFNDVIACALKVAECNACMKRIVANPTAGSCGVIPAVLVPLYQRGLFTDEEIVHALFVAAGFGQIIASRASIAGAEGGCQAEIGAAAAMGAVALTALKGGTAEMCAHACSMALSNLLGLVCDPIAGLVEVPCVQRNVVGAMNALSCSNMALAGIEHRVPTDEVIDAMRSVGDMMSADLKETARGGLASTQTAQAIVKMLIKKNHVHDSD